MLWSTRQLLIVLVLALHGPVSLCGPGSHVLAGQTRSALPDDGPTVAADDPCPICQFHLLGQLWVCPPLVAARSLGSEPVLLLVPCWSVAGLPGTCRPRAPPSV